MFSLDTFASHLSAFPAVTTWRLPVLNIDHPTSVTLSTPPTWVFFNTYSNMTCVLSCPTCQTKGRRHLQVFLIVGNVLRSVFCNGGAPHPQPIIIYAKLEAMLLTNVVF